MTSTEENWRLFWLLMAQSLAWSLLSHTSLSFAHTHRYTHTDKHTHTPLDDQSRQLGVNMTRTTSTKLFKVYRCRTCFLPGKLKFHIEANWFSKIHLRVTHRQTSTQGVNKILRFHFAKLGQKGVPGKEDQRLSIQRHTNSFAQPVAHPGAAFWPHQQFGLLWKKQQADIWNPFHFPTTITGKWHQPLPHFLQPGFTREIRERNSQNLAHHFVKMSVTNAVLTQQFSKKKTTKKSTFWRKKSTFWRKKSTFCGALYHIFWFKIKSCFSDFSLIMAEM